MQGSLYSFALELAKKERERRRLEKEETVSRLAGRCPCLGTSYEVRAVITFGYELWEFTKDYSQQWQASLTELARLCPGYTAHEYEAALTAAWHDRREW